MNRPLQTYGPVAFAVIAFVSLISFAPASVQAQLSGSSVAGAVGSCAAGTLVSSAITSALSSVGSSFSFGGSSDSSSGSSGSSSGGSGMFGGSSSSVPVNEVGAVKQNSDATHSKEFTLDRLASCAAKDILHQMTVSTINWINSGFNGNPSFITDPKGFLLDTANQLTGEMLSQDGPLRSLCSPWSVDIRLALALPQTQTQQARYACTLSTIISSAKNATINGYSIQGFVNGDFKQGGWPAFISMTTASQNNPVGIYLQAHSDLLYAMGQRQSSVSQSLLQGQGFLSWQKCETVNTGDAGSMDAVVDGIDSKQYVSSGINPDASPGSAGSQQVQQCHTETPGSSIVNALNVHTSSGVVETEMANDINSVVNALITQLTKQMLTNGLHSLSSSGSGVTSSGTSAAGSYVSQLQSSTDANQTLQYYSQAVGILQASQSNYLSAQDCLTGKLSSANSASTNPNQSGTAAAPAAAASTIQSYITMISTALTNRLQPELSTMTTKLNALQGGGAVDLTTATNDLTSSQTDSQAYNQEASQYLNYCNSI